MQGPRIESLSLHIRDWMRVVSGEVTEKRMLSQMNAYMLSS